MLELFTRKVCIFFLKSRLLFNAFYCFCMFVNKHFGYLKCPYFQNGKGILMRNLRYTIFCMRTNMLLDLHICINVPLIFNFSTYHEHTDSTKSKLLNVTFHFMIDSTTTKLFNASC